MSVSTEIDIDNSCVTFVFHYESLIFKYKINECDLYDGQFWINWQNDLRISNNKFLSFNICSEDYYVGETEIKIKLPRIIFAEKLLKAINQFLRTSSDFFDKDIDLPLSELENKDQDYTEPYVGDSLPYPYVTRQELDSELDDYMYDNILQDNYTIDEYHYYIENHKIDF